MIVGLTGGIGSGKTLVSKVFAELGIPIYYADIQAKKITNTHKTVIAAVEKLFGNDIYVRGELNREKVAAIVFSDQSKLEKLNAIIHPIVKQDFELWCEEHSSFPYVIKEAAIIIETGSVDQVDELILVTAPVEKRIQRVIKRDQTSEEEVQKRIRKQLSDSQKIPYANYVIENDDMQLIIPQILEIHQLLEKKAESLKN